MHKEPKVYIDRLDNGLTLLVEPNPVMASAAMTLMLPGGAAHDEAKLAGAASIAAEWCFRGAGDRDTRQLNEALDSLGCHHDESVRSEHLQLSAVQLGRCLDEVLDIYADIVLRPRLEDKTFDPSKGLVVQDLASLEDEPAQKCNLLLREQFYPDPLGRSVYGTAETLERITAADVRQQVESTFSPVGAIMAVAGNVGHAAVRDLVEKLFGDWQQAAPPAVNVGAARRGFVHEAKPSAQTHIGIAYPAATIAHPAYYAGRVGEAVLSWGMGSRLFTEVREKRGLVYHVSCRYHSLKDYAGMFAYAGTRPEVAQQTYDVTVGELRRIGEGVEDEELSRAKTQLRSTLIMQGESTSARAGSLVNDYYNLGRVRSLKEISDAAGAVTADDVREYVRLFPAEGLTVLLIGQEAVKTSAEAR